MSTPLVSSDKESRFNPLFIGARLRPRSWPVQPPGPRGRFNPLFIGARLRPSHSLLAPLGKASSFNPLFIGARLRPRKKSCLDVLLIFRVSIPSSSGHVFGQRPSQPRTGGGWTVSIPSSSGHVFGPTVIGQRTADWLPCFNPLFIGARLRPGRASATERTCGGEFQSPLHRGTSSDRECSQTAGKAAQGFNPLFIGARLRTMSYGICDRGVSGRFNPLFIGACHRPNDSCRITERQDGFNPLFIGARLRPQAALSIANMPKKSFNPLFIGARLRTVPRSVNQVAKAGVSIPSSSGHVFGPNGDEI